MGKFKDFVKSATTDEQFSHPLLSYLVGKPTNEVSVSIHRPKDILGYKTTKLYVNVKDQPPVEYQWNSELNDALIAKGIRGTSQSDEIMRFSLAFRWSFKSIESRFGEGFFNAVLLDVIEDIGLSNEPPVAEIFGQIHKPKAYMDGRGYQDCQEAVKRVFEIRINDLSKKLLPSARNHFNL